MHFSNLLFYTICLFCVLVSAGCKSKQETDTPHIYADAVDTLTQYVIPSHESVALQNSLSRLQVPDSIKIQAMQFYSERDFRCAWFNEFGLTEQAGKVVNLVTDYMESGILDTAMLFTGVVSLYEKVNSDAFTPEGNDALVLESDLLFTLQFLYLAQVAWGGIGPDLAARLKWYLPVKKYSQPDLLKQILSPDNNFEPGKEPVYRQYLLLKDHLKKYLRIQKEGGFAELPFPENSLLSENNLPFIEAYRRRLTQAGITTSDTSVANSDSIWNALTIQIKESFGLSATPELDSTLINELNVPVKERIQQMLLNLERWKWVPADPGSNFIIVNIPEFKLHVFENGAIVKSMKVIVGKAATHTVIFSGSLKYIVFNPYWNIPRGILKNEILPAIKANRSYLTNHQLEIVTRTEPTRIINANTINWNTATVSNFPYIIRQRPDTNNALGQIKFLFPNDYSIYLHDTPAKELFEQEQRLFSHGCIRIAEPKWLAGYLLKNSSAWDKTSIETVIEAGVEKWVALAKPVPVYVTYFTSWVDPNGIVNFRKDFYDHDRKLAAEVFGLQK